MGRAALFSLACALAALLGPGSDARADDPCADVVASAEDGIGGTGLDAGDSGIGGTGLGDDDSGIGGTGIYGTITRFGSICVNGLRIQYPDDVSVEINDRPADPADLALGQVVWVEAHSVDGELWTEKISVYSAVVGPVTAVDPEERRIAVSGQIVEVPDEALVFGEHAGALLDFAQFELGEGVDVYGLRRADGRVVASRIDRVDPSAAEPFEGPPIDDLLLDPPQIERLSVEGYLREPDRADRVRIDGLEIHATPAVRALEVDTRILMQGRVSRERVLRPDRVVVRPLRIGRVTLPPRSGKPRGRHEKGPAASAGPRVSPVEPRVVQPLDAPASAPRPGFGPAPASRAAPEPRVRPSKVQGARPVGAGPPEKAPLHERPQRPQIPDRPARPERPPKFERPEIIDRGALRPTTIAR